MIPMIKVLYGNKGIGKTKFLVSSANAMLDECTGDVVFIHRDNSLVTSLKHQIRYVSTSDFPINTIYQLYAFICGLIAQNYDIKAIFVDGLSKYEYKQNQYPEFFNKIKNLSEKFDIQFFFSVSGDISGIPEFVNKEYSC
jgi:hypothetical protein